MFKRFLLTALAALSICCTASAQSFKNILGGAVKAVSEAVTTSDVKDITGTWSYQGVALGLESDKALNNIAGGAVSSTVETKIDEYLEKAGIKPGAFSFTFNADSTCSCNFTKMPVKGTYSINGSEITINLSSALKVTLTGTVKANSNGIQMLFSLEKYMDFIKAAAEKLEHYDLSSISSIVNLLQNYKNINIGFKLSK